jgi:predicted lipoprotein
MARKVTLLRNSTKTRYLTLLTLFFLLSCINQENRPDPRTEVLEAIAVNVIVPRYEDFQAAMEAAAIQAETFCDEPNQEQLEETRSRLSTAYLLWKKSEIIAFGPHKDQPWAIAAKLDLWPARPDNIQEVLDGDQAVDEAGLVYVINGAKGLPAIQWLLWERGEETLTSFTDTASGERRCALLTGLTNESWTRAQEMVQAWSPEGDNWVAELIEAPGPLERFPTSHDAVAELVNRMIFTVENIRLLKLGKPIGLEQLGQPQPDRLEAPHSGNSLAACHANLTGVGEVFYGSYNETGGAGIVDLLPEEIKDELTARFDEAFNRSEAALYAIVPPLSDTIFLAPDSVEEAISTLRELQIVLQVDLAQALSVTVRFNDTDGD